MVESDRKEYRKRIYDRYVTEKTNITAREPTERDFVNWSNAAKSRVRGWLPQCLDTPILDMGCGGGQFLFLLEGLGYSDLTGVDISGEQIELSKTWCRTSKIHLNDVREFLAGKPNHFGLIIGLDIIEHFDKNELFEFLELISNSLRAGGRLILQTPNAESPWGMHYRYDDLTHEIAFDPHCLQYLLAIFHLVEFEARESGPYVHGLKSVVRMISWSLIRTALKFWCLAETGTQGSGVYTRVFMCSAIKVDVK